MLNADANTNFTWELNTFLHCLEGPLQLPSLMQRLSEISKFSQLTAVELEPSYELKGLNIVYMYVWLALHGYMEICLAAEYTLQSKRS